MNAKQHARVCNRFEDMLDFLETLPDMIEWSEGAGTIHYLVEPEDVQRTKDSCFLTGAALMVQLVFLRSQYRSEFIATPEREELILHVESQPST
jgi:hypothetical protein